MQYYSNKYNVYSLIYKLDKHRNRRMNKDIHPYVEGTRVILGNFPYEVIDKNISGWLEPDGRRLWRYRISKLPNDVDNFGSDVIWVSQDEIMFDISYYRGLKLNKLLYEK